MRSSSDFAQVTKEIVGDTSPREFAAEVGVSHSTIYDMLAGRIPSYRIVRQVAEHARVDGRARARLFATAGYVDESARSEMSAELVEAARRIRELPPEHQRTVWRIIENPKHLEALGMLLDDSVMAWAAGCEARPLAA